MTKLMASDSQSILRQIGDARLDIAAEHIDGDGVADLQPEPSAEARASKETSGGPL